MQSAGTTVVAGRGEIKSLAVFATINLGVGPVLPLNVFTVPMPPFQMPGAEFSLGVLLVAGALIGKSRLDPGLRWRLDFARGGWSSRRCGRCWR